LNVIYFIEQYFSYIRGEDALKTIKLVRKKMALRWGYGIAFKLPMRETFPPIGEPASCVACNAYITRL
jgi:hypothetical protein